MQHFVPKTPMKSSVPVIHKCTLYPNKYAVFITHNILYQKCQQKAWCATVYYTQLHVIPK